MSIDAYDAGLDGNRVFMFLSVAGKNAIIKY